MIPFSNRDGLRDYRASPIGSAPARWPWLVIAAFLLGLVIGAIR